MKVTGHKPSVLQDVKGGHRKESDQANQKDGLKSVDESVKTSSFTMDKIKLRISAEPEIRSDRVTELKGQIKSGEYEVDSLKLAGKILVESLREDTS